MDGIRGLLSNLGGSIAQQMRNILQAVRESRAGKLDAGDAPAADQTVLRYKLDPDERGVLKSATPSQSQIAVTNQEQTNIRRLSAEAQRRGEDVVAVDVQYHAEIVDGKLVIVAGRTEVTSAGQREPGPKLPGARLGQPPLDAALPDALLSEPEGSAGYSRIGAANREAADSMRNLNLLDDDTALRMLNLGLAARQPETTGEGEQPE